MRRRTTAEAAFTLVELLVVIGIISVLIAMVLPALNRARAHANELKCKANLRSIGHAMAMYTQQYGVYTATAVPTGGIVWPVRLRPFMGGNQAVFHCPSQDERRVWNNDAHGVVVPRAGEFEAIFGYELGELLLRQELTFFSYGYNSFGCKSIGSVSEGTHKGLGYYVCNPRQPDLRNRMTNRELRANRVKVPSAMIAVADSMADGFGDLVVSPTSDLRHMSPGNVHRGGANVLFCDGHVEWHMQTDLLISPFATASEGPRRRLWNNDNDPCWD